MQITLLQITSSGTGYHTVCMFMFQTNSSRTERHYLSVLTFSNKPKIAVFASIFIQVGLGDISIF
jgi:hypothetical protein